MEPGPAITGKGDRICIKMRSITYLTHPLALTMQAFKFDAYLVHLYIGYANKAIIERVYSSYTFHELFGNAQVTRA